MINTNYKKLYIKYKVKYLQSKEIYTKPLIMYGGSLEDTQINYLINVKNQINHIMKITNNLEQLDTIMKSKLEKIINTFIEYLQTNDIPLNYLELSLNNKKEFIEQVNQINTDINIDNLKKLYKLRKEIYTIDETNINDILDIIIIEFNIYNVKDIEKLFRSTILGYNKNYIINYMVLFRLLNKNKKQLTTLNNNISYLTIMSLLSTLHNSLNNDEYIPMLILLINEYIRSFPIKKIINIKNPQILELNNEFNNNKIRLIDSYDTKNNVIIYKSGDIKETKKAIFDDLVQIIYSLFRIPIFSKII
jgi:hypothetical protein